MDRFRWQRDALTTLLEQAPLDDEPTAPEEEKSAREARAEIARGDVLSADDIRRQVARAQARPDGAVVPDRSLMRFPL